jgi:ketosteroid isomerase-like protein
MTDLLRSPVIPAAKSFTMPISQHRPPQRPVERPAHYAVLMAAVLTATTALPSLLGGGALAADLTSGARSSCGPVEDQAEKVAILKVITDMQAAWNRGDFRGYMQGFKNPDVVFVSGGRFQAGWQGTLEHYIRDYGTAPEARGTLRFYDIQIEMLSADAAQLISRYQLVRQRHPQYGINTRLMRKIDGRWVIALNHVSSSETPPVDVLKESR